LLHLAGVSGAGLVQKGLQVNIGGLREALRINYGWSGEKINLKLREL
jgi:hypothetical protein